MHLARQQKKRVIVLVFNVKARENLLRRGLRPSEVMNFHSFLSKAYRAYVNASVGEAEWF